MGGEDVFADQVNIRGPELIEGGFFRQVFKGRDIIYERVEPDIRDVAVVERQLDAPGESGFWSRDRKVAELLGGEKSQNLIAA